MEAGLECGTVAARMARAGVAGEISAYLTVIFPGSSSSTLPPLPIGMTYGYSPGISKVTAKPPSSVTLTRALFGVGSRSTR